MHKQYEDPAASAHADQPGAHSFQREPAFMAMSESDRAPEGALPEARRPGIGPNGRGKLWLVGAVALALAVWAGHWLYQRWIHVYIDDARIDGEVVTISSRVSGWITELPVIEGD